VKERDDANALALEFVNRRRLPSHLVAAVAMSLDQARDQALQKIRIRKEASPPASSGSLGPPAGDADRSRRPRRVSLLQGLGQGHGAGIRSGDGASNDGARQLLAPEQVEDEIRRFEGERTADRSLRGRREQELAETEVEESQS